MGAAERAGVIPTNKVSVSNNSRHENICWRDSTASNVDHTNNTDHSSISLTATCKAMENIYGNDTGNDYLRDQTENNRDLITQSAISIALGLSAFIAFCVRSSLHAWKLVLMMVALRFYGQDGPVSTRLGKGKNRPPRCCRNYQTHCLDGFRFCIELRRNRFWPQQDWMPLWYGLGIIAPVGANSSSFWPSSRWQLSF